MNDTPGGRRLSRGAVVAHEEDQAVLGSWSSIGALRRPIKADRSSSELHEARSSWRRFDVAAKWPERRRNARLSRDSKGDFGRFWRRSTPFLSWGEEAGSWASSWCPRRSEEWPEWLRSALHSNGMRVCHGGEERESHEKREKILNFFDLFVLGSGLISWIYTSWFLTKWKLVLAF